MPEEPQGSAPDKHKVPYLSKTRIKKKGEKLGLDNTPRPPQSEEESTLNELYEDDLFGLGNE